MQRALSAKRCTDHPKLRKPNQAKSDTEHTYREKVHDRQEIRRCEHASKFICLAHDHLVEREWLMRTPIAMYVKYFAQSLLI